MIEYADEAVGTYKLYRNELPWQRAGLRQTNSGYGKKLTTSVMLQFDGSKTRYRVYCTCFSNSGTNWITYRGKVLYLKTHWQDEVIE